MGPDLLTFNSGGAGHRFSKALVSVGYRRGGGTWGNDEVSVTVPVIPLQIA